MEQVLKSFLGSEDQKLSFHDIVKKHYVWRKIPEFKERFDFEVDFKINSLPCSFCSDGLTGGWFYRMDSSEDWKLVGENDMPCDHCKDRMLWEEEGKKQQLEHEKSIAERLMSTYFRVPERLMNAGFKNFEDYNESTAVAKQKAMLYIKEFLNPEIKNYNLLFQGNPGTGKSHLCSAIVRNAKDKGFIVGYLTTGKVLSMIKETYQQGAAKTEAEVFRDLNKLDLLCLDDLGSEAIGGNNEWRQAMLFEIIESRSGKPTIYTSNLTEEDLNNAVGSRVFSRLFDNTKFIDLFTDDYRKRLIKK